MKNLIKCMLFVCALGYSNLGYAQFCEFDTLSSFGQTRIDGIVQLNDKSFLMAGRYGIGGQLNDGFNSYKQFVFLRKVDTCNQKIWEILLDSADSKFDYFQTKHFEPKVLKKQEDFYLLSMGIHLKKDSVYKFDENGNYVKPNPADKALFGSAISENKFFVFACSGDSLQLFYIDSNEQHLDTISIHLPGFKPEIIELKKTSPNQLNLLVKSLSNDSNYRWLIIDSSGSAVYDTLVKGELGKIVQLALNHHADGFYSLEMLVGGKDYYLSTLDAHAVVNQRFALKCQDIIDYQFLNVSEHTILLRFEHISMIFDADLNFLVSDTLTGFYDSERPQIISHNAILTSENQVFQTGYLWSRGGISSFPRFRTWIKKSYLFPYVKSLRIEGPSSIENFGLPVQFEAIISPINAANKNVSWSVNDTNKAVIVNNGYIIVLRTGIVVVRAKTTDGSNLIAEKNVWILPFNSLLNQEGPNKIILFPNPAHTTVQIESKENTIENSYLTDLAGKIIQDFGSDQTLDVSQIANGIYLLHISSAKGQTVKKLWIDK